MCCGKHIQCFMSRKGTEFVCSIVPTGATAGAVVKKARGAKGLFTVHDPSYHVGAALNRWRGCLLCPTYQTLDLLEVAQLAACRCTQPR